MASGDDYYAILGLTKQCTSEELRTEYKKLALKWHPDRCSSSPNPLSEEEAKKKFQDIQQAYSVLSDGKKKFLYDMGFYDANDDEDKRGMGEFLNEMINLMNQNRPSGSRDGSLADLEMVYKEMFESDSESCGSQYSSTNPASSVSSQASYTYPEADTTSSSSAKNTGESASELPGFCIGAGGDSGKNKAGASSRRKNPRTSRR